MRRVRERLSCAVGNVFNDIYRQLLFSFVILFFMKVIKLSASHAGLIVLSGQISDALISPLTGYLGDRVQLPFVSKKIGVRKSWHLLATVLMAISVPLLFNRCFLCDGRDHSWLPLVYYGIFASLIAICYNMVEINHLAYITTVAVSVEECTAVNALRTMFTFLSGVYVYVIAWALLGQDSEDSLGPNNLSDFAYLSWIATGTGVLFAFIFYIGTKKPQRRLRKTSTYLDFMNVGGVLAGFSGTQNENPRKTSIAHTFVDMFMGSLHDKTGYEEQGNEDIENQENGQRKRSLMQKFIAAFFYDEDSTLAVSPPETETEETTGYSQQEHTTTEMVSEIRSLDRERKKSILVKVIDGLLSRSEHGISTGNSEDHALEESTHTKHVVSEKVRGDEEDVAENTKEGKESGNITDDNKQMDPNTKRGEKDDSLIDGDDTRDIHRELSVLYLNRKRKSGVVGVPDYANLGLSNFGFNYERHEEMKIDCDSDTSNLRKKSVGFKVPDSPVLTSAINEEGIIELNDDESLSKQSRMTEIGQNCSEKWPSQESSIAEGDNTSSDPTDNPNVPCRSSSSSNNTLEKKPPKTMKDWMKDPSLYKVAFIFTCSRLVQDAVYTYLPLFLLERLQFSKEAVAYFPLVLLTSATTASMICDKLNRKIGIKWSYLLAASFVMGGVVWSYFQTTSIRDSTYAPVVIIGSGMSIMYVMALTFITELIGENKETSGSVISIITIIARLSSGGLIIGIQECYPEEGIGSNEAISNYVHHVFAMAPGILTLVGFLLVLFFQPSTFVCKTKAPQMDVEAQGEQSSMDVCVSHSSSESKTKSSVKTDENQNVDMIMKQLDAEETKL